jgi:hypothetical protein
VCPEKSGSARLAIKHLLPIAAGSIEGNVYSRPAEHAARYSTPFELDAAPLIRSSSWVDLLH